MFLIYEALCRILAPLEKRIPAALAKTAKNSGSMRNLNVNDVVLIAGDVNRPVSVQRGECRRRSAGP